jgi:hypothetical protein
VLGNLADGVRTAGDALEDGEAGGVAEGFE